tara:strand:- start:871 stop:1602 length:732 start_codon:yes stop_codon:yes gene_type:complete
MENITMNEKRVRTYPHPPQRRQRFELETYEYHMPFNYENVTVNRRYFVSTEFHGVELNPVNSVAATRPKENLPPDTITITDDQPIVRVAVIGSACVPPGFVQLEAKVLDDFTSHLAGYGADVYPEGVEAPRFRINNLWGKHLRVDQWLADSEGDIRDRWGKPYSNIPPSRTKKKPTFKMKSHYRENPLVGMSCAIFEIPRSSSVSITGGSDICAWQEDNFPDDVHYSFRIIRVTVVTKVDEPS